MVEAWLVMVLGPNVALMLGIALTAFVVVGSLICLAVAVD